MIFAHNKQGPASVQIINAEPKNFKHLVGHLPSDILPNEKNKYKIPINNSMSPTDFWTLAVGEGKPFLYIFYPPYLKD